MNKTAFIDQVDAQIEKHHLLNHPFYKAWNAGELDVSVIREYAGQYFKHVSAFPRYLSSIHTNCNDIHIRQVLLENLMDEELGNENHPELWMRFAEGMGNTRDNVQQTKAIKETEELVNTFMKLSKSDRYHIGLAALYCYESMQPEISETKKDGLRKFYGIEDENTLKFFTVHMHADKWHREVIRKLIEEINDSDEKQDETMAAVQEALYTLNNFLTGMEKTYC
ncbi:MAG: CADD family putative folate metabolism protein [Candidatus Marinimicrobia bacterium]|nr:CADD family putative folate metabolism protein [Candidatus Neomarinimicrobiota bacterium]